MGVSSLQVEPGDYARIAQVAKTHFGIIIGPGKEAFIARRIGQLARSHGLDSVAAYCARHLDNLDTGELARLANALSTNHTFFYREPAHFERFRGDILDYHLKAEQQRRDIRVWCAAASTGEEPYTLAMLLRERLGHEASSWKAGLLATDVSERALGIARAGQYSAENVDKLPPELARRYFRKVDEETRQVVPELAADVTFRRLNLTRPAYPFRRPFHVVFCRNVMIYFDQETRRAVLGRIRDVLVEGGHLFIGHSEGLTEGLPGLQRIDNGVFRAVGRAR